MARLLFSSLNNRSNTLDCFITNCTHGDPFLLLPPPPPDPDPDSSSSIPIDVQHSNRLLPNFLIAAASFLALSFLLLLLLYFLLRLRRRRRRLLRSLAPHPPPPPPPPPQNPDLFDDDDVPHHVWFIRTVGLDEVIVKAIPTMVYKSLGNNGDCSVCLGEFRDGEIVKLLPKCAHAFHVDCIDTWLRSHVNCPLCRAAVVVDLAGGSESTRNEIGEEDQESCLDTVGLSNLTAGSSSSSSSSSLSREEVENGHENENDMQPIRRSVSMDTLALGMIMLRAELDSAEGKLGNGKREIELKGVGICKSKEMKGDDDNLGKLGSDLKRSMSSRSGRFFFPRYGRGWTASVLPL